MTIISTARFNPSMPKPAKLARSSSHERQHLTLSDLSPDQAGEMALTIDRAEVRFRALSGTCGVLRGLLFLEMKKRLNHGQWGPWLKKYFGKSQDIAEQSMAVGRVFLKIRPMSDFETLALEFGEDLRSFDGCALDTSNPIVREVANWVGDRSFYQLRQELVLPKGGKTYERDGIKGVRKDPTPEQAKSMLIGLTMEAAKRLADVHNFKSWCAVSDAELDGLADHCATVLEEVRAWRRLTKSERNDLLGAELTRHINAFKS